MDDESRDVEIGAEEVDPSHQLDLETVFAADGATAEMQALAIRGILDAAQVPSVMVGTSTIPSLPFEVRVPRDRMEQALILIAEAEAAGPAAAEEAERAGEEVR